MRKYMAVVGKRVTVGATMAVGIMAMIGVMIESCAPSEEEQAKIRAEQAALTDEQQAIDEWDRLTKAVREAQHVEKAAKARWEDAKYALLLAQQHGRPSEVEKVTAEEKRLMLLWMEKAQAVQTIRNQIRSMAAAYTQEGEN